MRRQVQQDPGENIYACYMLTFMATGIYTLIFADMGVSWFWYIIVIAIAVVCGYFADKDNPIPYIAGCVVLVLAFPIAAGFYFEGRSSFVNIELFVPLIMAIIPALAAQFGAMAIVKNKGR